ncbi:MAG: hypothetical protein ACLT76_09315 [Clostridium fessum]
MPIVVSMTSESDYAAKKLVKHGDVRSLSICAGQLKQAGANVMHGVIYELSLVLAGANPGAFIDSVYGAWRRFGRSHDYWI